MNGIAPIASISDVRTVKCKLCSRVVFPSVFTTHLAACGPRHAETYAKLAPEGLSLPNLPDASLPIPTLCPLPSSSSSPLVPLPTASTQPNAYPLPALPLPPSLSANRAQSPGSVLMGGSGLLNIEDDEDDPEDAPILPMGMAMGSPPLAKPPLPTRSNSLEPTSGGAGVGGTTAPAAGAAATTGALATSGAAATVSAGTAAAATTTTAKTTKKRKAPAKSDDPSVPGPPSKKSKLGETASGTTKFKKTGPVDLDRQCGVILHTGEPCRRSITCKNHSIGAKRGVPGRSQSYDVLFELYKGNQKLEKDAISRAAAAADALADLPALPEKTPDEEGADIMDAIKRLQPGPVVTRRPLWHMARPLFGVLDSIREAVRSAQGQLLAASNPLLVAGVAPIAATAAMATPMPPPQQQ